jgi:hypothetical protein
MFFVLSVLFCFALTFQRVSSCKAQHQEKNLSFSLNVSSFNLSCFASIVSSLGLCRSPLLVFFLTLKLTFYLFISIVCLVVAAMVVVLTNGDGVHAS